MRRRTLLRVGALALAGLGAGGLPLSRMIRQARFADVCRAALARSFPASVMAEPATEAFIASFTELAWQSGTAQAPGRAIALFLVSSNVVVHLETGEALEFDEIFDPHRTPCMNRLAANFAPGGEHDA